MARNSVKLITSCLVLLFFFISFTPYAQIKVAAVGNSVTYGYGLKNPQKLSYPAQLQNLIGDKYKVRNFGHSGATLLTKGHRPYIKTKEYQEALNFAPDIVIIHLGLNDTDPRNWPNYADYFAQNYSQLITSFRQVNPKVTIYITTMTPIFSGHPRFLSGTRNWYNAIQQLIPQIAKANHTHLIDLHSPLEARADLFDDNLHPNKQGAGIIAHQVALAIAQLKQPLSLNSSLGSHMVLQRNRQNLIFGTATPGDKISLSFAHKEYVDTVNSSGKWSILLPPTKAGGPYTINITNGKEKLVLKDILFGDVYFASGQSNMAFPIAQTAHKEKLLQASKPSRQIRVFKAQNLVGTPPTAWDSTTLKKINNLQFFKGKWQRADRADLSNFSAIAYSFALDLAQHTDVPIGIIEIAVGGSTTESWIKRQDLENNNLLGSYIHNWRHSDFIMDWVKKRSGVNLKNATVKHQRHPYGPGYNYEAGISHWVNTQLTGVLWYQGASNAHNIELYKLLFTTLVQSWRSNFNQNLPFYFVQLSSINRPSWGRFRNAQRLLEKSIPNAHMAVTLDLGDSLNVHPTRKIPVGKRLSYLVRTFQYHQPIHGEHPTLSKVKSTKKGIVLSFTNLKQLTTTPKKQPVLGFQYKDIYGFYHPVKARILNHKQVILEQPSFPIQEIVYGYKPYTHANLHNKLGVPVSTFTYKIQVN